MSNNNASDNEDENEVGVINTEFGTIEISFYEKEAPKHVESFKILAKDGYFDGVTFHRIIPGFMIQGGDPNTLNEDRSLHGSGGHAGKFYGIGDENDPNTWNIPAEFNELSHTRGAVSMARTNIPNSAGSQFFICVKDVTRLDRQYSIFGRVISGMDVVDKIVKQERDNNDNPLKRVEMTVSITNTEDLEK
ncbi:MAG: peptidylprolyl isomerase [Candidatus Neomarinimicrobiota bacterium]